MSMSAVEQWRLIAELQARRKQATLASGPDYEVIEDGCR
jgi:ribosomal protein L15E